MKLILISQTRAYLFYNFQSVYFKKIVHLKSKLIIAETSKKKTILIEYYLVKKVPKVFLTYPGFVSLK